MTNKPVSIIPIFEPIKSKLCDLYENEVKNNQIKQLFLFIFFIFIVYL